MRKFLYIIFIAVLLPSAAFSADKEVSAASIARGIATACPNLDSSNLAGIAMSVADLEVGKAVGLSEESNDRKTLVEDAVAWLQKNYSCKPQVYAFSRIDKTKAYVRQIQAACPTLPPETVDRLGRNFGNVVIAAEIVKITEGDYRPSRAHALFVLSLTKRDFRRDILRAEEKCTDFPRPRIEIREWDGTGKFVDY